MAETLGKDKISEISAKTFGLEGQKFGKLTVLSKTERPKHLKNRNSYWLCRCDCGKEKVTQGSLLKSGGTQSCGCIRFGKASPLRKKFGESDRHGLLIIYRRHAIKRNLSFELSQAEFNHLVSLNCYYCERPPESLTTNTKHSYGRLPYNGVDRVDNDKGYCVDNCVPCCGKCNNKKMGVTIHIARKMLEFVTEKKVLNVRDILSR